MEQLRMDEAILTDVFEKKYIFTKKNSPMEYVKGAFNNYVDQILPNFAPPPLEWLLNAP